MPALALSFAFVAFLAFVGRAALELCRWRGGVLRAWLLANVFAALLIPLNGALGTNYMFVSHKPDTPSLLDVMGPWPWYILVGSLVGLVAMALCYLPFFVIDHSGRVARASRTRTTDEGR